MLAVPALVGRALLIAAGLILRVAEDVASMGRPLPAAGYIQFPVVTGPIVRRRCNLTRLGDNLLGPKTKENDHGWWWIGKRRCGNGP